MSDFNALQIYLNSIHFDRVTDRSMYGYVVGLIQANVNGPGQLYVSPGAFKVRRDNKPSTKDEKVFEWDGNGELIFSTALKGLDQVQMRLWFVRDRRRTRDAGAVLKDLFDDGDSKDAIGSKLATVLTTAIEGSNPTAAVILALVPGVAHYIGKRLEKVKNGVKIFGSGAEYLAPLLRGDDDGDDDDRDVSAKIWGGNKADKGYFKTSWELVTMHKPESPLIQPKLPDDLLDAVKL